MFNTSKTAIQMTSAQTLTGVLAVANNQLRDPTHLVIYEESQVQLDVSYTTGAGEAGTTCNFVIEFNTSHTGANTWIQENQFDLQSGVATHTSISHTFGGGAGATTYTMSYNFPVCARAMRIRIRETGVGANFGNVTIFATVTPGSSGGYGLQEVSLTASDIEIGAVEIKDGTTDNRAIVNAANTARAATNNVLLVQQLDENGLVVGGSTGPSVPQAQGVDAVGQDPYATIVTATAARTHMYVKLEGANNAIISIDSGVNDHFTIAANSSQVFDDILIANAANVQAKNATAGANYANLTITIW